MLFVNSQISSAPVVQQQHPQIQCLFLLILTVLFTDVQILQEGETTIKISASSLHTYLLITCRTLRKLPKGKESNSFVNAT
jgi:hypothetical protein